MALLMTVIDLFAGGARGWCYAARELELDPLGIELDDAACRVSRAAGFPTRQGDVSALNPRDFAPCTGLVGSPPCPAFSMAGKGAGRAAIPFLTEAMTRLSHGVWLDRAELDEACEDATAHLVLEPLRWVLALRPRWVALEQVEPVLPLWEAMAAALRLHGYQAWCGVVSAETFGTPQTRRRAILVASLDGPVAAPVATHQRYVPPRRQAEGDGLFELPEPERIVVPEDRGLRLWVSMAQALGWDGGAYRLARGPGITERHGARPDTPMSEPAPAISTKVRTATWQLRANSNGNASVRDTDEPAPTITAGHNWGERVWLRTGNFTAVARDADGKRSREGSMPYEREATEPSPVVATMLGSWVHDRPAPTVVSTRRSDEGLIVGRRLPEGEGRNVGGHGWVPTHYDRQQSEAAGVSPRAVEDPAPTVCASKLAKGVDVWVGERPATTVNGDPRISEPGHHDAGVSGSQQANAVRVSIEEAAILQGFPPGHPWEAAGSKSAAYRCVGNAIPPQMALAALLAAGAGRGDR